MVTAILSEKFRARYAPKSPDPEDKPFIGKVFTWIRYEYIEFGAYVNQWMCVTTDPSDCYIEWSVPEQDLELVNEKDEELMQRVKSLLYDMTRENEDALGNRWVFRENILRQRAKELLIEMDE